jgi:hypothetical protein
MRIECTECEMYETSHCGDCLVTALLHPPDGIVEIDEDLDAPLQALSGAGLIPVLRFRPRESSDKVAHDKVGHEDQEEAEAG